MGVHCEPGISVDGGTKVASGSGMKLNLRRYARVAGVGILCLMAAIVLAGCDDEQPSSTPTLTPTPTSTPMPTPTPVPTPTSTPNLTPTPIVLDIPRAVSSTPLPTTPTSPPTPAPTPTPPKSLNPTAPNDLTAHLSGDFTDTDGDGMTDAAERKYGFDAQDALSFPSEPELTAKANPEQHAIEDSGIGAYYEVDSGRIDIKWTDPDDGDYSLSLKTEGADDWNIYYGGHRIELAEVELNAFNLRGDETLVGKFSQNTPDGYFVADFPSFIIDLSAVEFLEPPVLGDPSNRVSYTFSSDFPSWAETQYREFLKRVFPILYEYLGPPAETLNVFIDYSRHSDFVVLDGGRTLLTDASFIPRLIVHEFVHAWKGRYTVTSDENWVYDDSLSGFEEATAEGMAFEIIHEYVRSYPDDPATIQLLEGRPSQYWSSGTTHYDAIKHIRWTGAGDFWNPLSGAPN